MTEVVAEPPPEPAQEAAVEPPAAPVAEATSMPPPAPKKKGRPTGSKDAAPRTRRKPVEVRIEPLEAPEPPPPPRASTPRPARPEILEKEAPPPPEIEEPPSPRTMLRETSRHLMQLRNIVHQNKKSSMGDAYAQKLVKWPC